MLNQAVVEALYSATFVQDYIECIDNLPQDLQRHLSRLRELDATCQIYLRDIDQQQEELSRAWTNSSVRTQALNKLKQALICTQEIGDEKLQIVQIVQDLIENKTKQLDLDYRNLDFGRDQENNDPAKEATTNGSHNPVPNVLTEKGKRARRARTESMTDSGQDVVPSETRSSTAASSSNGNHKRTGNTGNQGKKKKRKTRQGNQNRDDTPLPPEDDLTIDPNEPTYCLCDQISYGEMIMCDNDLCPIEWFHFSCVSLSTKPKGKWFCPKCRGDRPNVMKPKAQFLKELALYNKEKEEKS